MSKPSALVGAAVKSIRCHAGVILQGLSVTGLHHKDHKVAMTVTPYGVYCDLEATDKGRRPAAKVLIPWANIYYIEMLEDAA